MTAAFALLAWAPPALAQVPSAPVDKRAYLELVSDLWDEVGTMDAVTESKEERQRFIAKMKTLLDDPSAEDPTRGTGNSWSGLWYSFKAPAAAARLDEANYRKITTEFPRDMKSGDVHAIHDLTAYVEQRLGAASARALKAKTVAAIVYGGRIDSLIAYLGAGGSDVYHLPSFYERWGISKYLISATRFADGRPRLAYTVPPSTQYLEHYRAMLNQLEATSSDVILDLRDQQTYRTDLIEGIRVIHARLKVRPDFAALGYYGQWLTALARYNSPWRVLAVSDEASDGHGLGGKIITIKHQASGAERALLIIKSDKAIWGESSAFIAEGLLALDLKGLFFLGSAGGLSNRVSVYDVSAPKGFAINGAGVKTPNLLAETLEQTRGVIEEIAKRALSGLNHDNTYSPIEQSESYLLKQLRLDTDTIDVEQSLIAERVERHNAVSARATAFGAVNVITDLPTQALRGGVSEHDLDRVDFSRKARARLLAVELALKGMTTLENSSRHLR